jgi:hypothetical protein
MKDNKKYPRILSHITAENAPDEGARQQNIEKENKELAEEIQKDFENRRDLRRGIETKWLLNINFMLGNQYSYINRNGELVDDAKQYYWQEKEVFNHIAPIIEARLAKFTRVNTRVNVRPASASDNDINIAKLSVKLIEAAQLDNNFIGLSAAANYWSEITGTSFYKIMWNKKGCRTVSGSPEGGISIQVCPPYEIYPDSLSASGLEACRSLIHAKAYPVETIEDIWGVSVPGGEVSVIGMEYSENAGAGSPGRYLKVGENSKSGYAMVIERYEKPSKEYPDGRLVITAGGKVLYNGILPYQNGLDGARDFPFVRQTAFEQPASFFGVSLIERLIPIQRAYNAVKNRKHEFINRLSTGVLAVEDGSVDIDNLEQEGLSPGKVLVYRQGSVPPQLMSPGAVPGELRDEEDRLLAEFVSVSGISDFLNSSTIANTVSGYALSLLLEQDYARLSVTTESIRNAVRNLSKHILRLYRQFGKSGRIQRISGENGKPEIVSFLGSELTSDDIVLEADSDMVETPAVRRSKVEELLKLGLLSDENGKISNRNREKILEMMGFGNWESARSMDEAHIRKAAIENTELMEGKDPGIEDIDDHDIHFAEHARFLVIGRDNLSAEAKKAINKHIRAHKILKRMEQKYEMNMNNGGINHG